MTASFLYPPSPPILQWLSAGQLANRLQRTVRLWVLLHRFYGLEPTWTIDTPSSFSYSQLRDRLYSSHHPAAENLTAQELTASCSDPGCICHQTMQAWLFTPTTQQTEGQWLPEISRLTGLSEANLKQQLTQCPFATVHRSIRDDLKQLVNQGWLRSSNWGQYQCLPPSQLPNPPVELRSLPNFEQLSPLQTWELLRTLESIAFIQPHLHPLIESLWQQVAQQSQPTHSLKEEPTQRIFLQLDYILPDEIRDRVDDYQDRIEQLWRTRDGGVIQFDYWLAQPEKQVQVTVYPVCLHYVRRAKYLSAWGQDPQGQMGWHNYRLDRIVSPQLKVLAWGDPTVPKPLKDRWHRGQLPTPAEVQAELEQAWGFNFYYPKERLILRFPPAFARWYVDNTLRHPTFHAISYRKLPTLVKQDFPDPQERQQVLQLLRDRPSQDAYYVAWVRSGDINVTMRLRDWRPNGEVIAPIGLRQRMAQEAALELGQYAEEVESC